MTTNDLIDWVSCWVPLGGRMEVAHIGTEREHATGTLVSWVVRKDGRYAVVWVSRGGWLHGKRGCRLAEFPRDPMIDNSAISAVVRWGTRSEAAAELRA